MIDQVSDTLAIVKPQLTMFGGLMQDYLNIVFLGWTVVDHGKDVGKSRRRLNPSGKVKSLVLYKPKRQRVLDRTHLGMP
jgi:hypothetical protein